MNEMDLKREVRAVQCVLAGVMKMELLKIEPGLAKVNEIPSRDYVLNRVTIVHFSRRDRAVVNRERRNMRWLGVRCVNVHGRLMLSRFAS